MKLAVSLLALATLTVLTLAHKEGHPKPNRKSKKYQLIQVKWIFNGAKLRNRKINFAS